MHKKTETRDEMVVVWTEAAKKLGFRLEAPFVIDDKEEAKEIKCVGFIHDFGSPAGMVIGIALPPRFRRDAALTRVAKKRGWFCSFINPESYRSFDEEHFKEALLDWGFFGPVERKPAWYP